MKKVFLGIFVGFALVAGYSLLPAGFGSDKVVFSVPAGAGVSKISHDLEEQGLLRSRFLFRLAVMLSASRSQLKAGEYEIPVRSNLWQVLGYLRSGKSLLHEFVVPEGFSSVQIARVLAAKKLADEGKFESLVKDAGFAKKLSVPAKSLEGFLFPDSYQIPQHFGEERIIRMMVERFRQKVPVELLEQGREHKLTPYQVLTLASIVERECRADAERPKVASVFLNRLSRNMRLESCATVRFAMDKYQGPVLSEDLHFKSPYNTYRHRGLPPTPICSPGLASIQAAAQPADTPYLFFVVAKNGEHHFSQSFQEHVKAKLQYKSKVRQGIIEE